MQKNGPKWEVSVILLFTKLQKTTRKRSEILSLNLLLHKKGAEITTLTQNIGVLTKRLSYLV